MPTRLITILHRDAEYVLGELQKMYKDVELILVPHGAGHELHTTAVSIDQPTLDSIKNSVAVIVPPTTTVTPVEEPATLGTLPPVEEASKSDLPNTFVAVKPKIDEPKIDDDEPVNKSIMMEE